MYLNCLCANLAYGLPELNKTYLLTHISCVDGISVEFQYFEIKTEADSNDVTESCPHDDTLSSGMFTVSGAFMFSVYCSCFDVAVVLLPRNTIRMCEVLAIGQCLSICLSVCLSRWHIVSRRLKILPHSFLGQAGT